MKFLDVVENIQKQNKGYIVFVRCGIFFTAVGKDAVITNKLLGLKPVCIKEKICKCGIPVSSFKNYIPILKEIGYSYVVYDYEKDINVSENKKYRKIAKIDGKVIEEDKKCIGCENCCNAKNLNSIDNNLKLIEEMLNGKE